MLNISQEDIEKIYRLIKQHKNGIALDDIAGQYPPKDPVVPYSLAQLVIGSRVKLQQREKKLYFVAV